MVLINRNNKGRMLDETENTGLSNKVFLDVFLVCLKCIDTACVIELLFL